jgi:hypothetical protein
MEFPDELEHPAFLTGVGTIVGYGLMIGILTAVVFGIPYLLFLFL